MFIYTLRFRLKSFSAQFTHNHISEQHAYKLRQNPCTLCKHGGRNYARACTFTFTQASMVGRLSLISSHFQHKCIPSNLACYTYFHMVH